MIKQWGLALMLLLLPLAATPAIADEAEELRKLRDTTIALLNQLVQQGILTREKADELIRNAQQGGQQSAAPAGGAAPATGTASGTGAPPPVTPASPQPPAAGGSAEPPVVRVPYVPETVKQEIRESIKQDVLTQAKQERWGDPGTLPDWLNRLTFSGDARLRFQAERFPNDNQPNALPEFLSVPAFGAWPETNTTDPVNILRVRARFGVEATVGSTVTMGIRLASGGVGTGANPATENQTLGNYNSHESVGFDRAYLSWRPTSWFTFTGGRLGNPFFSPTTLVWANDISLEGALVKFSPHITRSFDVFATAGLFPILDVEPTPLSSSRSKWLFGYQTGLHWDLPQSSSVRVAAALYDYRNIEGISNPNYLSTIYSGTAAPARQGGNTVFDINNALNTQNGTQNYLIGLASKFHEANVASEFALGIFGGKHLILDVDWVKNYGFNQTDILARTGQLVSPQNKGTQEKLAVGDTTFEKRNAWQAYIGYRRVEADSVVDAFTDADFHLGGTDAKGYYLGAKYAFETNSTFEVRWFSAKQITGLPLSIDLLQVDAMAAF